MKERSGEGCEACVGTQNRIEDREWHHKQMNLLLREMTTYEGILEWERSMECMWGWRHVYQSGGGWGRVGRRIWGMELVAYFVRFGDEWVIEWGVSRGLCRLRRDEGAVMFVRKNIFLWSLIKRDIMCDVIVHISIFLAFWWKLRSILIDFLFWTFKLIFI